MLPLKVSLPERRWLKTRLHVETAHMLQIRMAEADAKRIEMEAKKIEMEAKKTEADTARILAERDPQLVTQQSTSTAAPQNTQRGFMDKRDAIPHPKVDLNSSESDWGFFKAQWARYTTGMNMNNSQEIQHLWAACDENLQRTLHNGGGGKITDPKILMDHIKLVAVKRRNNLLNIVELQRMGQQH